MQERGVSDRDQCYVFAATEVSGVEMIDGGRTLAIRLQKADGDGAVVLLSLRVAEDLNRQTTALLNATNLKRRKLDAP